MQPGEEAWNAQRLVAGLTQTPGIGSFGQELMTGRHSISNQLLADFQAIPGMYAGDDELEQWSRLPGNQSKKIVVVHGNGEALEAYTNGTRTRIGRTEFHQEAAQADLVLHRRGAHWERIMPPQHAAFDATGNALVPSTELFVHPRHGSIDIFRHAKPNGIDKIEFTLHLSPNAGAPIQHQQTMFVQHAADGARSWLKYSASGLDGKLRSAGGPVFLLRAAAAAAEALGLELVVVDATASKSTQTLCHSLGMTSGKPAGEYKLIPATMKHNADHRITEGDGAPASPQAVPPPARGNEPRQVLAAVTGTKQNTRKPFPGAAAPRATLPAEYQNCLARRGSECVSLIPHNQ